MHTDDIAWYHAMFDWSALMIDGVERPFLAAQRPRERADTVVDGAPDLPHDPVMELVVGRR